MMKFAPNAFLMLALCTGLIACDTEKKSATDAEPASPQGDGNKASDVASDVGKALFDKSLSKKACEILTAAKVAEAFNVPESELKQLKMMGCIYTWEKGDQELHARLSISSIAKTEGRAVTWFKNATKGMSQAETKAAMASIKTKAKKDAKVDSKAKKKIVDKMGDAAIGINSNGGIQFRDIAGLGDEARLQLGDGAVWVRVDNMMFIVTGYKGKQPPPPSLKGADLKNIAKVAMAATKKWTQDTMVERERDAITVAKLVLKGLPKH